MRPAPLIVALCWLAAAMFPARAQDASGGVSHFIDFRARDGRLGHTFIVYGRVDRRGMPLELHRAGLFPIDDGTYLAFLLPTRGIVDTTPADKMPASAIYRRRLTTREYAQLKADVAYLRAHEHAWHLLLANCNDFGIAIARSLGLAAPPNLLPPNAWVRTLKAMNGG